MRKNKITIKALILGLVFMGSVSSCKKDYFDINTDPNYPADVDVAQLLPSAEAAIAHVLGNNFQIVGGIYAEYWTQSPSSSQYKTYEQYAPGANDFDSPWQILYADALTDLKTIETKANADGRTQYVAISKILSAYTYQLLTDNFGDVPFSQSIQATNGVINPKYDKQEDIYNGIIALTKEGIALIDENAAVLPGSEDLIYGGDMTEWRKFGNTLLLRMYLRLSEVNPTLAQTGIAELDANAAEFIGNQESAKVSYLSEGGNTNPLYSAMSELGLTQNLVASATAINYYLGDSVLDPRISYYYAPSLNGSLVGLQQGLYTATPGTQTSYPSPLTGGYGVSTNANYETDYTNSALAPVYLISATESFFLQSEAAARGWLASGDAQAAYEAGISESFEIITNEAARLDLGPGLSAQDYTDFLAQTNVAFPAAGTTQEKLQRILTMKWSSLCGTQNIEAWAEQRRTGYPDFLVVSATSLYGNTILPARLLYPSTEVTRNGNFPGQKLIWDKVWWDVN
jgi:hypothetical protein